MQTIGLTDWVDPLLLTLTPTPNWCVTSEANVSDIHDIRAYLCHYSSLTGPRYPAVKELTSAVVTVPSVDIARGVRSRRCFHQVANLAMTSHGSDCRRAAHN
jgi:hypothetical protein